MKTYWLSSPKSTFCVKVDDDGMITKTAPICWKWKNKFLDDLIKYFHVDRVEELDEEKEMAEKKKE